MRRLTNIFCTLAAAALATACGNSGDNTEGDGTGGSTPNSTPLGAQGDLVGQLTSESGSKVAFLGWTVMMIERDTGLARCSDVDGAGLFKLKNIHSAEAQSLVLLTPDFLRGAVFAAPAAELNAVQPYFRATKSALPQLTQKGPVVVPASLDGLTLDGPPVIASGGKGVPDGLAKKDALALVAEPVDTDKDGVTNDLDRDIDNDGLVNALDPDDDGDTILDPFDADADATGLPDSQEPNAVGDQRATSPADYVSVQLEQSPPDTGSVPKLSLIFTLRLREGAAAPQFVDIRGPSSLFDQALIEPNALNGLLTPSAWDRRLLDDGKNDDGGAGDHTYSRRVLLASGKAPRKLQTLLFRLANGATSDPWYVEVPFTFPPVTLGTMTTTYDAATETVTLASQPFGAHTDFTWAIDVFSSSGQRIHSSELKMGTEPAITLPVGLLDKTQTYTYVAKSETRDRIAGLPGFVVIGSKADLK